MKICGDKSYSNSEQEVFSFLVTDNLYLQTHVFILASLVN